MRNYLESGITVSLASLPTNSIMSLSLAKSLGAGCPWILEVTEQEDKGLDAIGL